MSYGTLSDPLAPLTCRDTDQRLREGAARNEMCLGKF